MNCDILYKYFLFFFYNTLLFEDEYLEMFKKAGREIILMS